MNPQGPRPDKQGLDERATTRSAEPSAAPAGNRPLDARNWRDFPPPAGGLGALNVGASNPDRAAAPRLCGPSAPQASRPGPQQGWEPVSPRSDAPRTPAGPNPPAAGGATPRPPSRAGVAYRGLPESIRIAGWLAIAVAVGAILGATGPTAIVRIKEVAAIQPGLLAWYTVRAMGFLAYFVLAGSVLYGLLLSTKILDAIAHRPVSFALHKDLAIVALILASLHGGLLVFDQSFDFTPRSIIVPFASPYSPITVGIGQLTFYASFVVTASFYVRRHIGQRAWRILHYVTFLAFIGATFHGIASGSDSGSSWAFWVYLVPCTLSIFLLTYRIVISIAARAERSRQRKAGIPAQLGPARGPLDRPGAFPGGF